MKIRARGLWLALIVLVWAAPAIAQDGFGRIEGRVTTESGRGVGGVTVTIPALDEFTITNNSGKFAFASVPAGSHSLEFRLGDDSLTETVAVDAGGTARVERSVDWRFSFAETITVFSASKRVERIVEAPAAVTTVGEEQIEREAAHGQLPKLMEFTPGAEATQSGIYDYNFNTRGFNSSLNRRVATLIDGRDPSVPFLGAQEWAAISFPLDDVASLELVRGPSAALYGANASSGVLNLTTKDPRLSPGGSVRVTGGELSSRNLDFRYAGGAGESWFFKATAGVRRSDDFSLSRMGAAEYTVPCTTSGQQECLPQEPVPLAIVDDNRITFGSVRIDRYAGENLFTLEGGQANIEGPLFQTGIGRVQLVDVERPWARFNFSRDHWNVLAAYTSRTAPKQLALASGANLALDTERLSFEVQTNWDFAGGRARVVAGASHSDESIDSRDPATGRQTLMFQPVDSDKQALFGQLDWKLGERVKLVLAGRWDDSTLHDSRFSPKGSVVVTASQDHTLRLTYNEAFQVANYSEFFLYAPAAPAVSLVAIEATLCTPFGVDCGFGQPTPVLAVGNEDLELEEVTTLEFGYSGIFAKKAFVTIDYYTSENENFITDLLPECQTALGMCTSPSDRINPNFAPYQPPPSHPMPALLVGTLMGALGPSFAILSNGPDGSPVFTAASYTNFGRVDTEGVDVGVNLYIDDRFSWQFSYSWFDFEIKDQLPGFDTLLLPNSPKNRLSTGVTYVGENLDVSVSGRWSDEFLWAVGPFQGTVESYTTVDLTGNYAITDNWSAGLNVANLLDDEHWESFGGDILGRRALAHVTFHWE